MLKMENNLVDVTPPPSAFLLLLSHHQLFLFFFLFHPPPSASLLFPTSLFSSPLLLFFQSDQMTVDLFTFLQLWECLIIYNTGFLLGGICLSSPLSCVSVSLYGGDLCALYPLYFTVLCVFTVRFITHTFYNCIFAAAGQDVCFPVASQISQPLSFFAPVSADVVCKRTGKDQMKKKKKQLINIL